MPRILRMAALAALLALLPGCYVWVDNEPRSVDDSYDRAWARIEKIERKPYERRGRAGSLKLWIYDSGDDRLIKASVPMWIVRKVAKHVAEHEGDEIEELERWDLTLEEILDRGPGLILKASTEEEQVLVWLK